MGIGPEPPAQIGAAAAEQALGLLIGALAGVVDALGKIAPIFDDTEVYGLVRKSIPKMVAEENGAEVQLAIAAAAITKLIRQQIERGTQA